MRLVRRLMPLAMLGLATIAGCDVRPVDLRWQALFAAFEEADQDSPPEAGAILFVGSSSVSGWDLEAAFPSVPTVNRGLPGATFRDLLRHADRTIEPYSPGLVVLYGGENDLEKGAAPEEVMDAVLDMLELVRSRDPDATLIVLSIKSSPRRWSLRESIARTNVLLRDRARSEPGLEYVDVAFALLDEDGRPRAEFFDPDGLHLNEDGYRTWSAIVGPRVTQALAARGVPGSLGSTAADRSR